MSKYNGWTNHETWTVNLWLANNGYTPAADNIRQTADEIKEFVNEFNPLANNASLYSDLLTTALQEVNWREIAEALIEDKESEDEE